MSTEDTVVEALARFTADMTAEMRQIGGRIDQTNGRLDKVVERLDQTVERLDKTVERLDQTVERLDQTVERLDQTVEIIESFKADVSEKLNGISSYLLASEKAFGRLESRVVNLETRMDDMEQWRDSG